MEWNIITSLISYPKWLGYRKYEMQQYIEYDVVELTVVGWEKLLPFFVIIPWLPFLMAIILFIMLDAAASFSAMNLEAYVCKFYILLRFFGFMKVIYINYPFTESYLPAKWYLESTKSAAPPRFEKSTLRLFVFEAAAYFSLRSLKMIDNWYELYSNVILLLKWYTL